MINFRHSSLSAARLMTSFLSSGSPAGFSRKGAESAKESRK
jgi:hypothetical protein